MNKKEIVLCILEANDGSTLFIKHPKTKALGLIGGYKFSNETWLESVIRYTNLQITNPVGWDQYILLHTIFDDDYMFFYYKLNIDKSPNEIVIKDDSKFKWSKNPFTKTDKLRQYLQKNLDIVNWKPNNERARINDICQLYEYKYLTWREVIDKDEEFVKQTLRNKFLLNKILFSEELRIEKF